MKFARQPARMAAEHAVAIAERSNIYSLRSNRKLLTSGNMTKTKNNTNAKTGPQFCSDVKYAIAFSNFI